MKSIILYGIHVSCSWFTKSPIFEAEVQTAFFIMVKPKLLAFCAVFATVLLIFVLKFALLMARYGITADGKKCELNATNNETFYVVNSNVSNEFIFTTAIYGIVSVLRILEYVLLGKQFHSFLFKQEDVNSVKIFTKRSERFWYLLLF